VSIVTTAIIGAGVMGEALLSGLLRAGVPTSELLIADRRLERSAEVTQKHGVANGTNQEVAAKAQTVVLVVKPQDMAIALAEICDFLKPNTLVVSLAAGITTAFIENLLPANTPVIRVMPNTPALVDEGMAAINAGSHCTEEHMQTTETLLRSVGQVARVPEKYQDAVTAISGSGPAYIFYAVEAMIEGGVMLGLPRDVANALVLQTVYGAATMLRETGEHPTVLREQVTSPGGTTVAALRQFDDFKVRAAFLSAMEAARDRSKELGMQ